MDGLLWSKNEYILLTEFEVAVVVVVFFFRTKHACCKSKKIKHGSVVYGTNQENMVIQ